MTSVISGESPSHNGRYPFLGQLPNWYLYKQEIKTKADPRENSLLPCRLMWNNDADASYLMTSVEDPLTHIGLGATWHKPFLTAKRLSRAMRSYYTFKFFDGSKMKPYPTVQWLSKDYNQLWDGGGQIDRDFLLSITNYGHNKRKDRALKFDMKRAGRVEFTYINADGMFKGHLMVVKNLGVNMILPNDCKSEVNMIDKREFLGITVVHSADTMSIDEQSLINLYPFISVDYCVDSLTQYIDTYMEKIKANNFGFSFRGMSATEIQSARAWPVMDALIRGFKPMWSPFVVKSLSDILVKEITNKARNNIRIPMVGGRYYIAPASMCNQALMRGYGRLSRKLATIVVNDEDWMQLEGAIAGIRDILGGADMDDGCWCKVFIDHDGIEKLLVWRSPNQQGEYVLLELDEASDVPLGQMPHLDSRLLPQRIDQSEKKYVDSGIMTDDSIDGAEAFSFEIIENSIKRAKANAGVLGTYVNTLMTLTVMCMLPEELAAPLEWVVDNTVKKGSSLKPVKTWCADTVQALVDDGWEFPISMYKRYVGSVTQDARQSIIKGEFWIDELRQRVFESIAHIEEESIEIQSHCAPPPELIKYMPYVEVGTKIRQLQREALLGGKENNGLAYRRIHSFLEMMGEPDEVVLGAWLACYMNAQDTKFTDSALWLRDTNPDKAARHKAVGTRLIDALVKIGLLGSPIFVHEYTEMDYQDQHENCVVVSVKGVIFNEAIRSGYTPDEVKKDKEIAKEWRAFVAHLASIDHTQCIAIEDGDSYWGYKNAAVEVRSVELKNKQRLALYRGHNLLGYVEASQDFRVSTGEYTIIGATEHDGGLSCVLKKV